MFFLGRTIFLLACLAMTQSPPPAQSPAPPETFKGASVADLVKQQFGPTFTIATTLPKTILTADLDGDGVEDLIVVADSKDPLPDSYDFKYAVADPYNAFFGMSDPRMTAGFNRNDPRRNHDLLVIFGAGPDAWRSATPKSKFVLINVPFDTVEVGRMLVKKNKPPIFVIRAVEAEIMDSNVFWDPKKKNWKWQPGDTFQ